MKKETLITALVFFGAGFLAGYVFSARSGSAPRKRAPTPSAMAASADTPSSTDSGNSELAAGLPKGHPPVNNDQVIQFFKDAAARSPEDAEPRLKLANFLFDQRQFAEAIPWYRQALQLDPDNVDARTDMATCYFNLGNPRLALDELQQVLHLDPRHEATLFNLVVVNLEGTHDLAAAQKAWQRLDAINPGYPKLDQLKQSLDRARAAKNRDERQETRDE